MFNKVMVGVDGHEGGRDALALAMKLVDSGGKITLAYVYSGDPVVWRGSNPAYDAAQGPRALELLSKVRDEARLHPARAGPPSRRD